MPKRNIYESELTYSEYTPLTEDEREEWYLEFLDGPIAKRQIFEDDYEETEVVYDPVFEENRIDIVASSIGELDLVTIAKVLLGDRLDKTGPNYKMLCNFHSERHASFKIFTQKNLFRCFGCGFYGGPFTLASRIFGHEDQALAYLMLKIDDPEKDQVNTQTLIERLYEIESADDCG